MCGNNDKFVSTSYNDIKKFTSDSNVAVMMLYSRYSKVEVVVTYRAVDSTNINTVPALCKPAVECIDRHENCENWANNGECTNTPGYMEKNCAASCRIQNCVCEDVNVKCPNYAATNDQCNTNPGYMHKNCPASCGLCGLQVNPPSEGDCVDTEEQGTSACEYWRDIGDCEADYQYMFDNCKKTCEHCTV